jgi:integrase
MPRIPMPRPGTPEFIIAYEKAVAGEVPPEILARRNARRPASKRVEPRTLRWLCHLYLASPEFKRLEARTQRVRRQILEHCLQEPTAPGAETRFEDFPIERMTAKAIRVLRDRKGDAPEAANARVKALRQVFAWGLDAEPDAVPLNPARDVPYLKGKVGGFHSWTLDEVARFEATHAVGTTARLALALLLYTGQRRSDVVTFGRQHVRNGRLVFTQRKGRNRSPVTLEIPIVPELAAIIEAGPTGDLAFIVSERGTPFTEASFGNRFRKWCDAAGLQHCSAHGLRKAAAARLAECGASEREIMAITGHRTSKEVDRYTRGARQKVLAIAAFQRLAAAKILTEN